MIVKENDTHDVKWRANMDLTGATVRLIARTRTGDAIILDSTITDAVNGEVTHTLTGELPVARDGYRVELEATINGTIITFPNDRYARLDVIADLD